MEGLLLIDKPPGITSHDAVDVVRRHAGTRAVGHAGTLDPFATGLLIIGINKATKWLTKLIGLDKTYEAGLLLGAESDTFDKDGVVTPWPFPVQQPQDKAQVETSLTHFRGTFEQRAPLYSAKKVHGKKLYELARLHRADEAMRPTKRITVHELTLTRYAYPELDLHVHCSSGTYIRSLADDLGRTLNTGAYLHTLRRTMIGTYAVNDACPLDTLTLELIKERLIQKNEVS